MSEQNGKRKIFQRQKADDRVFILLQTTSNSVNFAIIQSKESIQNPNFGIRDAY